MMVGMFVGMFTATDRSKSGGNGRSLFVGRVMSSHVEPLGEKKQGQDGSECGHGLLDCCTELGRDEDWRMATATERVAILQKRY